MTVLTLIGTRPEAIKLAPLIQAMRRQRGRYSVRVCLTGQHRELLADVLPAFGIAADDDLDIMSPGQTLCDSTAKILSRVQPMFAKHRPDLAVVQGDTATAFAGALAAFYTHIPVAHVEAGLRTGDVQSPFPEEMNRLLIARLASFHFAATSSAADNLYSEGVPEDRVWVTGNTGIDAVRLMCDRLASGTVAPRLPCCIDPTRKLILVTAHRRENIRDGLRNIANAVKTLAQRSDVQIVFPVHPNPEVRAIMQRMLARQARVHLASPLEYSAFIELIRRAHLILSDSGGIQEEAPALGKPVLVLRNTTERHEAVAFGATQLVGTNPDNILRTATTLLDDARAYSRMARVCDVYGDGKASERICRTLTTVRGKREAGAIAV